MTPFVSVVVGLVLLLSGAEALVRAASSLARRLNVSPAVIGLTIVAVGTSLPEFLIGLIATMDGHPDLLAGTVIGSNLFNLGAILGLSAVIYPLAVESNTLRYEYPVMLIATVGLFIVARDGVLDRTEGIGLLALGAVFIAYLAVVVRKAVSKSAEDAEIEISETMHPIVAIVLGAIGVVGLHFGSDFAVNGASELARGWGWSERLIGLTIVALGTSAPELVVSVVAAIRRQNEIAMGNIVGSCIFNILLVLGGLSTIRELPIASQSVDWDLWWLTGATVFFFPLLLVGRRLGRIDGLLLLGIFFAYYGLLLRDALS